MGCGCGGSTPQAPIPVGQPAPPETPQAPARPPASTSQRVVQGREWTGDATRRTV